LSWRAIEPLPSCGWIRWAPKQPAAAAEPYLDLSARRIVWPEEVSVVKWPSSPPAEVDLVYLPPVTGRGAKRRLRLAGELRSAGMPVAAHVDPAAGGGSVDAFDFRVIDLLATWLDAEADPLRVGALSGERLWVVVPLIAGLTPEGGALNPWLEALASLAPSAVLTVAPELKPADRRRLSDRLGDAAFEVVFHGQPPAEKDFARALAERDLGVHVARPRLDGLPPRAVRNRALASALAECGELWLKLERSESEGVGLLAAARHLDGHHLDVAAVAREGNLALLEFLGPLSRRVVEETVEVLPGGLLRELRALWTGRLS
jgi:hypothetical protein